VTAITSSDTLIEIAILDRTKLLVRAQLYGPLAVHENPKTGHATWNNPAGGWNVTHVETGIAIHRGLGHVQAERLAQLLAGLDWSGEPKQFCKRNADAVAKARAEVLGRH
jgi:hypothetical protein